MACDTVREGTCVLVIPTPHLCVKDVMNHSTVLFLCMATRSTEAEGWKLFFNSTVDELTYSASIVAKL